MPTPTKCGYYSVILLILILEGLGLVENVDGKQKDIEEGEMDMAKRVSVLLYYCEYSRYYTQCYVRY